MSDLASRHEDFNLLSDDEFRARFRVWLEQHYPSHWKQNDVRPFVRLRGEELRSCMRLLNAHGYRAPGWPREFGGMGLDVRKLLIYQQEWDRIGGARTVEAGETHLGPTLFQYGTPEQRAYHLPRILNCDDLWVQGYSEPGSGSDLASLRTRAVRDGDSFVVNGQKIWTTQAGDSTHIFTLVRTGDYAKKQQGITFLLIDLHAPGIRVRPIVNLAGEDELCEVFFDDVRVDAGNVVGAVDDGWRVAKSLLGHERLWLGTYTVALRALNISTRLVAAAGLSDDLGVVDRLARLHSDLRDYRVLYEQVCGAVAEGSEPGPEVLFLKVYVTELQQRIVEFNVEVAGEHGASLDAVNIGGLSLDVHWPFMAMRPPTIYAGCNEVIRDMISKQVLGLPDDARG